MYLKQLKITNYKSFYETTELNFEPGFNVLLGANSSGKTSVLETIDFAELPNTPHRSTLNVPYTDTILTDAPNIELQFISTFDEISTRFITGEPIYIGIGNQAGHFYSNDPKLLSQRILTDALCFDIKRDHSSGNFSRLSFTDWPSIWRQLSGSGSAFPAIQVHANNLEAIQISNFASGSSDVDKIYARINSRIYKFSSERSVQATYGHHPDNELLPKGENLAYCVNLLSTSNPDLFVELNKLLHQIFPTIHWVGSTPNGQGHFELKVHTTPTSKKRGDLAVPINRVGTGVGNALAMLYVALTAQTPRFILLEEPNSFLHPRALRELLAILAEIGGKHQFFITTHSSDVLRTVNASTVILLEYDGQQTTAKQTSGKELHTLQAGMLDLGIRLTDLHGCDKVLWVEGQTEEAIFPILLRHFYPEQAQGIAILPLHSTGLFESKKVDPKTTAAIYKQLSTASFLAPPMVGIALDRERKKPDDIKRIEEECGGLVRFLDKPMLEDYLLNAAAIVHVLNQEPDTTVTQAQVEAELQVAIISDSCRLHLMENPSTEPHAAKVLNLVFEKLSRSEYRKTLHGQKLAEWILANQPNEFEELKNWFGHFLK